MARNVTNGRPSLHGQRVWVAGHTGLVGSALVRRLEREGCELLLASHAELDLTRQQDTENWMKRMRPDVIILAAARVGGIAANARYPVEFLYDNSMIAMNVLHAAHALDVNRVLMLGSSCIYPKFSEQPIREAALLTGALEPTNEAYALAKIAGLKLAAAYNRQYKRKYICAMPTNLYGPNDNFDPETSHVLPAMIRRFHEARMAGAECVTVWGSGSPRREFLHADDLADACVFLLDHYEGSDIVNIGSGQEVTIGELAQMVARISGYRGRVLFDRRRPDGTPRKLLDCGKLRLMGWAPAIALEEGIAGVYANWVARAPDAPRREMVARR